VIIFANGEIQYPQDVLDFIAEGDVLIAADGGARHCLSLGLLPKLVIGDFDSLTGAELDDLERAGVELEHHPIDKDETDLELALFKARELNPLEVIIFGALGARWDMTLANILLLAQWGGTSLPMRIVDGPQELTLLHNKQSKEIHGQPGDTVSLIPILGDAKGITTQGLQYPLDDGILHFGTSRGVSNVMKTQLAHVELEEGLLIVILTKAAHEQGAV